MEKTSNLTLILSLALSISKQGKLFVKDADGNIIPPKE
jgi:hypothetical protein